MRGDLTCPDTLDACLAGIDTVFLVWTAPAAAVGPALARIAKHARRIVFLSAPLKTAHPFFQQPNPSRALFEDIERTIEASGIEWTYLRAGMFALNARHFWGPQIRAGDVVRWPYLAAPTAPVDERDIAAVAVRTLTEEGHAGMEYVLTGPQSLSQHEQISTIGSVIGRSLRIEEISAEEARRQGLPGDVARRVGCRDRSTRVRHIHGSGNHRKTRTDVSGMGHGERCGISSVTSTARTLPTNVGACQLW